MSKFRANKLEVWKGTVKLYSLAEISPDLKGLLAYLGGCGLNAGCGLGLKAAGLLLKKVCWGRGLNAGAAGRRCWPPKKVNWAAATASRANRGARRSFMVGIEGELSLQ